MKKIFITLSAMILSLATAHAESFTYYMMTTANSPSIKITEPLINKLRESYTIDWKQNAGCAVKTQVERETNPIFVELVTGQMWMSLNEKNTNCVIDISKIRWVMVTETAYKFCVRADSTIKTFKDLVDLKDARVAYATGTVGKPLIESLNKDLNASWRSILLTNSNAMLTALMAKDIDAAMLNIVASDPQESSNNIRCLATTEVGKENSLSKISPKTNPLLSKWALGYAVGLKNVSDQQYLKISNELKSLLPRVEMPKNVSVTSIANTLEKELRDKVNDATINLHEATK